MHWNELAHGLRKSFKTIIMGTEPRGDTALYLTNTSKEGDIYAPSPEQSKLIAEANAVYERVRMEKIESLRLLLVSSHPVDDPAPYGGGDTVYVPVITEGELRERIEEKLLELIKEL